MGTRENECPIGGRPLTDAVISEAERGQAESRFRLLVRRVALSYPIRSIKKRWETRAPRRDTLADDVPDRN